MKLGKYYQLIQKFDTSLIYFSKIYKEYKIISSGK